MRGPLVSLVMPAFNAERTIGAALLGVVNQTYRDWEMVVIDDGSSTDIKPEIDQFCDKRIRLVRMKRNSGVGAALNAGLDAAQGRYVARMDADDVMEDWRLAEQLRYLMIEGLAICGTDATKFGNEVGTICNPRKADQIVNSFFTGNPFVHPTVMFDRHQFVGSLRYDSSFRCEEDYELWARSITPMNCGNMPRMALQYRTAPGTNANHPTKKVFNRQALQRFADRMGPGKAAPVTELNEFHMSGFVSEPAYQRMAAYAQLVRKNAWPALGMLQSALLEHRSYDNFGSWLIDNHRAQSATV